METPRTLLERQIFVFLDESLPDETKLKFSASETKLIVEIFSDFIYNRVDVRVLLDPTTKSAKPQVSIFESSEAEVFLSDLSKL